MNLEELKSVFASTVLNTKQGSRITVPESVLHGLAGCDDVLPEEVRLRLITLWDPENDSPLETYAQAVPVIRLLERAAPRNNRAASAVAVILFVLASLAIPTRAQATVTGSATVSLSYSVAESVTVTATPNSVTFTGSPNPQTQSFTVATTWQIATGHTKGDVNLYFTTATAALTDGASHNIPVANVFAAMDGGGFSTCATNPASELAGIATTGATCNSGYTLPVTTTLNGSASHTFALQLQNLSSLTLPAGSFTGTLNIVAGIS